MTCSNLKPTFINNFTNVCLYIVFPRYVETLIQGCTHLHFLDSFCFLCQDQHLISVTYWNETG